MGWAQFFKFFCLIELILTTFTKNFKKILIFKFQSLGGVSANFRGKFGGFTARNRDVPISHFLKYTSIFQNQL